MIKALVFVVCYLYAATAIDVNGYSWRDYLGEIPRDAVVSTDNNGTKVYIGQILHREPETGTLIPGTIYAGKNKMQYYWKDKLMEVDKNIKILCSHQPQTLVWVDVPNMEAVATMDPTALVVGGSASYPLFIGRVQRNNQNVIGKVTLYKAYEGMGCITENGELIFTKNDFQILIQFPAVKKSEGHVH